MTSAQCGKLLAFVHRFGGIDNGDGTITCFDDESGLTWSEEARALVAEVASEAERRELDARMLAG